MQDLKVIGVENGALLAASDDGERYRIAIDEMMQSRLRQKKSETQPSGPKLSPREIQAHIRAGMSAADVATLTNAPLEYIQRFEGPILAEREHIVASALSVPVHTSVDIDPLAEPATFGTVIRDRLASLEATGERWASWKDPEDGWIVKLAFTSDQIDHDARWGYDVRKHSLSPLNSEATTLSQQGELHGGLIPRLRAVGAREPDDSRFDSGAFAFTDESDAGHDSAAILEQVSLGRTPVGANNSFAISAISRSRDENQKDVHQTADLLEALRKRRGEREAASYRDIDDEVLEDTIERATPRLVDVPLDTFDLGKGPDEKGHEKPAAEKGHAEHPRSHRAGGSARKGRASMPSWDEIVFGARTDED